MSKRDLKKYLSELKKEQVEAQLLELYDKFPEVKVYYDFVFNPKEEKLINEAKIKIANEYFPIKAKRPKLRRSVAQKYIKHFLVLGVDAFAIADLMFFTIETAQKYTSRREIKYVSFYRSMKIAFEQAVKYSVNNGIVADFTDRISSISSEATRQNWENHQDFSGVVERIENFDET